MKSLSNCGSHASMLLIQLQYGMFLVYFMKMIIIYLILSLPTNLYTVINRSLLLLPFIMIIQAVFML